MIPELSHVETSDAHNFWITMDGSIGLGFSIRGFDLETQDLTHYLHRVRQCLKQIDPEILVRVRLEKNERANLGSEFPRSESVNEIRFRETKISILFDYIDSLSLVKLVFKKGPVSLSQQKKNGLLAAANLFKQQGFSLEPLSEAQSLEFFPEVVSNWKTSHKTIETGTDSVGLLRLEKMPHEDFGVKEWVKVLESLPVPFAYTVSFQRLDESSSKLLLERRLKQSSSGKDVASKLQEGTTLAAIASNIQSGAQLFNVEALFEFRRRTEERVSEVLDEASAKISLFSDTYVETYGVSTSFAATLPGVDQHVAFLETEEGLSGILPFPCHGEVSSFRGEPRRTLSLLREDRSLHHFDQFDPSFHVYNSLIMGPSGKGKSVLLGLASSSLLNDPNVCIIKVDVGGSHSKECELFGGTEYRLSLEQGSGINPFDVLKINEASDNDKIAVLSKFLGTLIQEQGEFVLSKAIRSEIESAVRIYIEHLIPEPSLNDFYKKMEEFPRRNLLSRWANDGLYGNAFRSSPTLEERASNALQYYNLSEIFQASDPEFAQAGIAAVLAQFNMEMLKKNGKRLVLICDEVPFFIKSCFEFFKFTTANVRKFGHATILSAQLSSDFVVNGDTGIIENSPQRFIFDTDGSVDDFQARFSLSDSAMNSIKSLNSIAGHHSEVLFQSGEIARKIKVMVTPEEYWRLTTSRIDKDKITALMASVPGLSLREAINCLSTLH
jgi:hypothetical protein